MGKAKELEVLVGSATVERQEKWATFVVGPIAKKVPGLEGENGGANHQRIPVGVEEDNRFGHAFGRELRNVVIVDITQTNHDAYVSKEGSGSQLGDVSNTSEWYENRDLDENDGRRRERLPALADGSEE